MSFKVLVDNPQKKYFPDQSIEGNILFSVKSPHFAEVKAKLVFEEATDVDYSTTSKSTASHDQLKDKETSSITVKSGDLDVGEHQFPFKVKLSKRIPSSYVGKYGHVKFFLKAWVCGNDDEGYEDEVEFDVFSPIHLNELEDSWLEPSTHLNELQLDRWCLIRDELGMEVKLPKRAFVVGELVNVLVVLTNKSHVNISAVKVKIFVVIQAKVTTDTRDKFMSDYKLLASDINVEIDTKAEESCTFALKIPPTAELPNFRKCSHFTQQTFLEVRAVLEDATKKNLKVKVALALGHIPKNPNLIETMLRNHQGHDLDKKFLIQSSVMPPLPIGGNVDLLVDLPQVAFTKQTSVTKDVGGFTTRKLSKALVLGSEQLPAIESDYPFSSSNSRLSCSYPTALVAPHKEASTTSRCSASSYNSELPKEMPMPTLPPPNPPYPTTPLTRNSIGFTVPVLQSHLSVESSAPVVADLLTPVNDMGIQNLALHNRTVTSSVGTQVTPPPRYEEVFSTLKKDRKRLKRQEELAF